jgi:hypothetical protein
MAAELGVTDWRLRPLWPHAGAMFEEHFLGTLRVSGRWDGPVPDYVLEILRSFDTGVAEELKLQLQSDGVVEFRK